MPPRKRAQSAPKTEDPTTPTEPAADGDDSEQTDTPAIPSRPEPADPGTEPSRSDLQTVDAPCADCFPAGWPDQSYAVGCEHGTWTRA